MLARVSKRDREKVRVSKRDREKEKERLTTAIMHHSSSVVRRITPTAPKADS